MNILDLIGTDGFIMVNKNIVKEIGLHEAILLGCLASKQKYWKDRNELNEGYFFCTAEQFEEETTLSPYLQREALKHLEELNFISTKLKGLPRIKYFRVNEDVLLKWLKPINENFNNNKLKDLTAINENFNSNKLKDLTYSSEMVSLIDVKEFNNNNIKDNNIKDNNNIYSEEAKEILDYLNTKTNSNYRKTKSSLEAIQARLNEGFSKEECFRVIDIKTQDWKDTEFEKYLRPSTLFRPTKFQEYLNQKLKDYKPKKTVSTLQSNNEVGVVPIVDASMIF